MFYYVYLDPQVISDASQSGEHGMNSLIGVLRGFLQNCFLASTSDSYDKIREKIENLPETNSRNIIKKLLVQLWKSNRFIFNLVPDDYQDEVLKTLVDKANQELLDLILIAENISALDELENIEIATLLTYQSSYFEEKRSLKAGHGEVLLPLSKTETEFFDQYLLKPLKHSNYLEILDKQMGKNYGGNYRYSLKKLFVWLEQNLVNSKYYKIKIYCLDNQEDEFRIKDLEDDLLSFKTGKLSEISITICLYDSAYSQSLQHDRFFLTDQIAIGIPRGMDFLDKGERKIRDITLDCKDKKEIENLLSVYTTYQTEEKKL